MVSSQHVATNVVFACWHFVDELAHLLTAGDGIAIPEYASRWEVEGLESRPVFVP